MKQNHRRQSASLRSFLNVCAMAGFGRTLPDSTNLTEPIFDAALCLSPDFKPCRQISHPPLRPLIPDSHPQRLRLRDDHHQLLPTRHPGINQIPLEQHVMLHRHRDDHNWIF
jgi:hypothetical protein